MEIEQILSLMNLISIIGVFFIGCYVFLKDSKRKINRIFFLMSIVGALWGTGELLGGMKIEEGFWLVFPWLGIIFLPSLFLHLSLLIAEKKEILKKLTYLYLPSFFLITFNYIDFLICYFIPRYEKQIARFYPVFSFSFFLYYGVYLLTPAIFLIKRYLSFKSLQEKTKMKNFLIGALIPVAWGLIFQVVIPFLYDLKISVPSPLLYIAKELSSFPFFLLGYLFIARGIVRFGLFVDYREILETIFKRLAELVIVTDREGLILLTNDVTLRKLNFGKEEIKGKRIQDLLKGKEKKWKELKERIKKEGRVIEDRVYFLTKEKEEIPFLLTLSQTKEGIIFVGRDIKEIVKYQQRLEKEVKERTKELKEAKTTLEVKVKARTKELEELAQSLEEKVKERTKELQERVDELERFHKLTVGRELKMIELKKEIERLKRGQARKGNLKI